MDKELLKIIGLNIKRARLKAGLNQVELANKLNVSSKTISEMETGMHDITVCKMQTYADALECNLMDFFIGTKHTNGGI